MRKSSYMTDVKVDGSNDHMLIHGYTGAIDLVNDKIVSLSIVTIRLQRVNFLILQKHGLH